MHINWELIIMILMIIKNNDFYGLGTLCELFHLILK